MAGKSNFIIRLRRRPGFQSGEEGEEVIVTVVRLRRDSAKGLRRMNSCEAKCESTLAKQNHLKVQRALACGAPSKPFKALESGS